MSLSITQHRPIEVICRRLNGGLGLSRLAMKKCPYKMSEAHGKSAVAQ